MIQITRLGLNKLFLWSEAERFQTYPQAMARLTSDRAYTRRQVAEELVQLSYEEGKHKPLRESQTYNLFGLVQTAPDKLLIKGINLLRRASWPGAREVSGIRIWEQADDEWVPTETALRLGQAYRENPAGVRWQQLLAEQLARFEPRTRVLIHLLSHGHVLRFESPGYFAGSTQRALLVGPEGNYAPFENRGGAFGQLLFDHLQVAIGPWWLEEIENAGFELVAGYRLEGARNTPPSTNVMHSILKASLYVFRALGILIGEGDTWAIDTSAFVQHLSPEVSRDLLGEQDQETLHLADKWQRLSQLVSELGDERGYIIASEAADRWGELSNLPPAERVPAFDALIRHGLMDGRIEILDRHLGQPRMGRGLLGNEDMRLVKLRVLT